jgi:hypothetical protein
MKRNKQCKRGEKKQPSIGSKNSRARDPTEELHDHGEGYESLARMGHRWRRRQGGMMRTQGRFSPDLSRIVAQFPNPLHPLSMLNPIFLAFSVTSQLLSLIVAFWFCPKCQNQQLETASLFLFPNEACRA